MNEEISATIKTHENGDLFCYVTAPDGKVYRSDLVGDVGAALSWVSVNLAAEMADWDLSGEEG